MLDFSHTLLKHGMSNCVVIICTDLYPLICFGYLDLSRTCFYQIRLDHFRVPMQCTGNSGCLPQGKRAAIVWHYPAFFFFFPCVQCFHVSIPPAVRPTPLRRMDMGSSLTCAQIWVRAVHTEGGQAQTSPHKSRPRRDRKTAPHPAPPGDRTQGHRIWILTL